MTHATATPARRRFGRRAVWIVLLVVVLLVIGAAVAMAAAGGSGADRYRTVAATRDAVDVTVSSAGTISPVNEADLRFPGSGTVTAVPVAVGQHVTPGQALASLDPTSLESQLASAQSTEATARARLAADKSGQASGSGAAGAASGAGGANAIPSGFSSGAAAQPAAAQPAATQAGAAQAGAAQPPAAQPAAQPAAAVPPAGQPAAPAAAAPAAPATPPAPAGSPSISELQDRLLRDQHQADLDLATAEDALGAATAACANLTPAMPAAPDTHQKPAPTTDPTTSPDPTPPPPTRQKAPQHPRDEAGDSTPAPTSAPADDPTTTAPSPSTTGEPDPAPTDTVARPASFTRPLTGHGDPDTCRTALATVLDLQQTVGREQQAVADDEAALDTALAAVAAQAQPAAPAAPAPGAPGADAGQAAAAQAGAGQAGAGQAGAAQAGAGGPAGAGAVAVPRSADGAGGSQSVSAAQLAADQAAVDSAVAQVAVAQQNLDQATMVSPIEGTVAAVNVETGGPAAGGTTPHVVVIGAGAQEVTTTVSDLDVGPVRVGAAAEVTPGGAASPLTGTVTTVGALNVGTAAAPAYRVTIGLAADAAAMPAGQSATISITTAHVTAVVAVPSSAVTTTGAERTVTLLEGTTPRVVPVEVGSVGPALTEITSGVAPGDRVVLADLEQPLPSLTNSGVRAVTGGGGGPPPPTGGR